MQPTQQVQIGSNTGVTLVTELKDGGLGFDSGEGA